eukprot:TRINITY_DN71305_c0_g1_i1.p1 TRINITY_DN71305_c0_g1~~TRINITY_DN71305_c0_g1_i1.p1  ORF type:complete len:115 (-),score=15.30 TRINITY_DN71305_c0_g1_i1:134-478(-)
MVVCGGWVWFVQLVVRLVCFFFQAEDGIRDVERSRGLGDVYKRQSCFRVNGVRKAGFDVLCFFVRFTLTLTSFLLAPCDIRPFYLPRYVCAFDFSLLLFFQVIFAHVLLSLIHI